MKDHSESAERNRHDILPVLRRVLPKRGTILEIASGTGQHAVHFAPHFPEATWQPTEFRPESLASIRAWADEAGLENLRAPLELDVEWDAWPIRMADAMVNINMLHISPWAACEALMAGAARTLVPGGVLYYYGAFLWRERETAASNLEFDRSLRARDASWGVRDLDAVIAAARAVGLALDEIVDMPNNNYSLILRQPHAQGSRAPQRLERVSTP